MFTRFKLQHKICLQKDIAENKKKKQETNKHVICQPCSVFIGKICTLQSVLGYRPRVILETSSTVFPNANL